MTDEIQDGLNRIKEMADDIHTAMMDGNLKILKIRALIANIELLEAELKLNEE